MEVFNDVVFISETNLGYDAFPTFKDFTLFADPHKRTCTFGGIAWYIKNALAKHVVRVCYNNAYISFRLDCVYRCLYTTRRC